MRYPYLLRDLAHVPFSSVRFPRKLFVHSAGGRCCAGPTRPCTRFTRFRRRVHFRRSSSRNIRWSRNVWHSWHGWHAHRRRETRERTAARVELVELITETRVRACTIPHVVEQGVARSSSASSLAIVRRLARGSRHEVCENSEDDHRPDHGREMQRLGQPEVTPTEDSVHRVLGILLLFRILRGVHLDLGVTHFCHCHVCKQLCHCSFRNDGNVANWSRHPLSESVGTIGTCF
mmetsp:Transcript_25692/g.67224  ORF Transcript_25692/g.67224 Transcript_25692/m.67224 type:complete len:233 (+) Transcript_25692:326-1024(+)